MSAPLLQVTGLGKSYPVRNAWPFAARRTVRVLDDVSFSLDRGETLGLVGESGSGKSTTGRVILKLVPASGGSVRFDGQEILPLSEPAFRPLRQAMQMVFQDPAGSLNPSDRVGRIIGETLGVHAPGLSASDRVARTNELLGMVGLDPAASGRYPHEFSGGQRQRIGIARALAVGPRLIIADEPVSALDVSVQAQILNLMRDLKARLGLSYLFIAHDLAVVRQMSDRVAVMYRGQIVETASSHDIYRTPAHPYTRLLLSAIPRPEVPKPVRDQAAPDLPMASQPSDASSVGTGGCVFTARCPIRSPICVEVRPQTRLVGTNHHVACHNS
ncbi:ABC transporter ATP-binding protein [Lichenicola cladoniae]|uniref:ABC transporter ATP-binding protein n=1 Tax=Lichenicola cladoniae TaxID=1484109 RepID=A0A6M8HFU8_9PROT|nr:ABC transporter ATP-binding protein [Lichenicola cladoniae]NPD65242.1 ABC transporter ATP-binding protein [Acetobacteraceae bacterium]QKE88837.1 ABC transporter ATP-binding protein [Lichenicola cladoniae]